MGRERGLCISFSRVVGSGLRHSCVCLQWPGVQGLKDPPHAQLPLFGGAAFERCMAEFQTAVTSLSLPSGKPKLKQLYAVQQAGHPIESGLDMDILRLCFETTPSGPPKTCQRLIRVRGAVSGGRETLSEVVVKSLSGVQWPRRMWQTWCWRRG